MPDPVSGLKNFQPGQTVYRIQWPDGANPVVEPLVFLYYVTTSYTQVRDPKKTDDFKFSEIAENLFPTPAEAASNATDNQFPYLDRLCKDTLPEAQRKLFRLVSLYDSVKKP